MSIPKAVIAGTVACDSIETPFGKVDATAGGSAVYASWASSIFAKPIGLISIIGEDFPKDYLVKLKKSGIDFSGVDCRGKTFAWKGVYKGAMNEAETIKTELNCLQSFSPKIPVDFSKSKLLFLANFDPDIQKSILDQMICEPFVILDTMNFWINSKKKQLLDIIRSVDLLLLNNKEACDLFACSNLISAGKKALSLGPRYVIIKKGEHGAILFSKNGHFCANAFPLETLADPTGAGDSFAGSILGYIADQGEISEPIIRKAIVYGSAISSFCVQKMGTEGLIALTRKDIDERYEKIEKNCRF